MNAFVMSTEPIDTTRCTLLCFILIHLLFIRCLRCRCLAQCNFVLLLLSCKCAEHNLRDGTSIQGLLNNSIVFAIFFCAIWFLCEFILYLYREFFLPCMCFIFVCFYCFYVYLSHSLLVGIHIHIDTIRYVQC